MVTEEAHVVIDANYLKLIAKHFSKNGNHINYDIKKFAHLMCKNCGFWCSKISFFSAPPYNSPKPSEDEKKRMAGYSRFKNSLVKQGIDVQEGRCQFVDGKFHQKGVDTLLTMALMNAKLEKPPKTVILLACDTDFVPAIKDLQQADIEVILYFFNDYVRKSKFAMSNDILNACSKKNLITESMFLACPRDKKPENTT